MHQLIELIARPETRAQFCILFVVLALAALPLNADTTLVTNFPATTSTGEAWATGGGGESGNAVGFVNPFSSSYALTQIQVVDNFYSSSPDGGAFNDLDVGLWQSTTNNLNTATELEAWVLTPTLPAPNAPALFTLTPSSSTTPSVTPTLNPSDFYFITETVPEDGANTAEWGWQWNNESTPQTGYYSEFAGESWFAEGGTTPVFSVNGNPITSTVPEPGSYAGFLGVALMGALVLKRRNIAA
jgi:hypothetical protein